MVHIAWLGKKSPFCGNVSYGNATTEKLKARGHKISFIHFDNPSISNSSKPLFLANDPEVSLPYLIKSQVYTIPSPRAEKELRLSLKKLKPDIVHASLTLSPLDFRLPEICNEVNVPLIGTFHPAFDANNRNLTASTQQLTYQLYAPSLSKFDKIVVFSEPQKNVLEKFGVPKEKQIIIPNGVDENIWEPFCERNKKYDEVKNKLGNARIFLYMGRIASEKNIESLLRSWRQTKKNNCKLVIVGDGPMKSTLENSFSNISKEQLIWWGAELDLETRVAIMQIAEVFFLPSLVEGLSLSLLEAMSTGTACVATDAGADGEVLDNGAGIVISTDNVAEQLKTIIPILVEHPSFTKDLGKKARERVLERYTISKNINSLEKAYMNLRNNCKN
ncbi:MAG: glycosyltransferase family 4 protein [Prochlorococcus marinus CUG1439]|uniref:glycosyltransferase family 4 protein n=1 Tax=Prochlorococcus sp. MIT 1314 TaxID=3096220 RepID=UPI001B1CE034|nr:glycosyltransferase family 4 protein [Prochlorococcus sp. MIT 1314]MCR8539718.1 glycosyltransferase family 4 protein [Prochlorococcus marinus CUG1439]